MTATCTQRCFQRQRPVSDKSAPLQDKSKLHILLSTHFMHHLEMMLQIPVQFIASKYSAPMGRNLGIALGIQSTNCLFFGEQFHQLMRNKRLNDADCSAVVRQKVKSEPSTERLMVEGTQMIGEYGLFCKGAVRINTITA